jgi:thiosulfate dehydrogenase
MEPRENNQSSSHLVTVIRKLMSLVVLLSIAVIVLPILVLNSDQIVAIFNSSENVKEANNIETTVAAETNTASNFWNAPDLEGIQNQANKDLVLYGKDLIAHTAKYLGPKGSVAQISNGLNCQNCHLDAGTKIFGNNYGSVASTYPKFRARSGSEETIFKRVNDCFERSLNGKSLAEDSKEMLAIKAYIEFVGSNVEKGKNAEGSGLKQMAFLERAADPKAGQKVYIEKCQSCHMENGEGTFVADGTEYAFPPLWGNNSYNSSAGLYRMITFAKYVKYNMPLGASHLEPQLSDEEAWDVAAFVNSQPRPMKKFNGDWPDISKKPIDHPFGPFADNFPENQHKYGPFKPIQEFYKK